MKKTERCERLLVWLQQEYPCGRPVKLRWRKSLPDRDEQTGKTYKLFGVTEREGNTLIITLSKDRNDRVWIAEETLIHEYTHCILWGMAAIELCPVACRRDHGAAFGAQYWEINDRYRHGGGEDEI